MKNKNSTRYFSSEQEQHVAKILGGTICPNSGGGLFSKSDVVIPSSDMSIECKTSMSEKQSFSIKKEWIIKHKEQAFSNRLHNCALCFSFDPNGTENY